MNDLIAIQRKRSLHQAVIKKSNLGLYRKLNGIAVFIFKQMLEFIFKMVD